MFDIFWQWSLKNKTENYLKFMKPIGQIVMGFVKFSKLKWDTISSEVKFLILFEVFEIEILFVLRRVREGGSEGFLLSWVWRKGKEVVWEEVGKGESVVLWVILSWHLSWYFKND